MKIEFQWIIYILSLSLQLCGAVSLLIGSFEKTKGQIIASFSESNSPFVADKNGKVTLSNKKVKSKLFSIYLNRIAFIELSFGYLVVIFADIGESSKTCTLGIVLALSALLIVISCVVAKKIAKETVEKHKIKNMSELPVGTEVYKEY